MFLVARILQERHLVRYTYSNGSTYEGQWKMEALVIELQWQGTTSCRRLLRFETPNIFFVASSRVIQCLVSLCERQRCVYFGFFAPFKTNKPLKKMFC